jgi:hypothetical protein
VLTKHKTETLLEERHLLLIGVGMVGAILREVVELLALLKHTARTLLQVQKLMELVSHQAMGMWCPQKAVRNSGPSTWWPS